MAATIQIEAFTLKRLALLASSMALLSSCAQGQSPQPQPSIKVDASITVYPITQAIAKEFNFTTEAPVKVAVEFSGTSGDFKRFCSGETDINNASRPIQLKETVFNGKSEFNLTIGELLRKQAKF